MPAARNIKSVLLPILILIAAVALWISDAYRSGNLPSFLDLLPTERSSTTPSESTRTGRYGTYPSWALVADRGNDGDSFKVRYHAFIEVTDKDRAQFLHQRLLEKGFARILTKGANLPSGASERAHEKYSISRTPQNPSTLAPGACDVQLRLQSYPPPQ